MIKRFLLGALLCGFAFLSSAGSGWAAPMVSGQKGTDAYVKYVKEHQSELSKQIFEELGVTVPSGLRIFIARTASEMQSVALAEQGGLPPEWAAGLAYPGRGRIYVHANVPIEDFRETLLHELSHIAFGRLDTHDRAPRWFGEGLAVWQSEGSNMERSWLLTKAALSHGLLPLSALNRGFPSNGARAGVAYAQAVHFIGYLHTEFGKARFQELLKRLRVDEATFAETMARVYGRPLHRIEAQWRSSIRSGWGWLSVVADPTALFVFCALLLVLGWIRRKRQRAGQMARLRALEADMDVDEISNTGLEMGANRDPYDGTPPTYH